MRLSTACLGGLLFGAAFSPACLCSIFPTCEADCDDYVLSPYTNALEPGCFADACVECYSELDCQTRCGADGRCLPCSDDVPCRNGSEACVAGLCRECTEDSECGDGRTCVEGNCGSVCREVDDCTDLLKPYVDATLHVSTSTGQRSAWFGCRFHDNYASQNVFDHFCQGTGYGVAELICDPCLSSFYDGAPCDDCTPSGDCGCTTSKTCPGGLVCRARVCGPCMAHGDCDEGAYCLKGRCTPFCTSDADCPLGRCHPSGECRQCVVDADCAVGRCYYDGCVKPCTADDQCFSGGCSEEGRCGGCDFEELKP